MIRAISDTSAQQFLAALERIQDRIDRTQREISSGLRITRASDHPDEVSGLLAARAALDQTIQVRTNLDRLKTEVDTAEQALQIAVKLTERVRQLGVQGVTETMTPADRKMIGGEVAVLFERLVAITGTQVQDRFIFSGDSDQAAPYAVDPGQPNGVTPYAGSAATREVMHPAGTTFPVSRTAEEIFDNAAPDASVFAAINSLRVALENGPTVPLGDPAYEAQYDAQTAAIDAAVGALRTAYDHLNGELAFYGTLQSRVAEAIDFSHKLEFRQRAELSEVQDADLAASILELNEASLHHEAALSARARQPQSSLFDYLK